MELKALKLLLDDTNKNSEIIAKEINKVIKKFLFLFTPPNIYTGSQEFNYPRHMCPNDVVVNIYYFGPRDNDPIRIETGICYETCGYYKVNWDEVPDPDKIAKAFEAVLSEKIQNAKNRKNYAEVMLNTLRRVRL